nr:hypothetical protein [uncultured Ruminococcus sp.]
MITASERIDSLAASIRLAKIDLNGIFLDKNDVTPCRAIELYLEKQLQMRVEKQNLLRRKKSGKAAANEGRKAKSSSQEESKSAV